MNVIQSTRLKTSQSRIPVASRNNVNNKKLAPKIQTSNSSKATNPCILKKQLQEASNSQLAKSDKHITGIKNSRPKENVQASVRGNIKLNCTREKVLPVRTNVKSVGIKEKDLLKCKPRSKVIIEKEFLSLKSNPKCLHNEKEKVPKLRTAFKCSDSTKNISVPKFTFEKENESPSMNCFSDQKDIKFEANEVYRNMILSEKPLSPSVCNLLPGLRMSSILSQRPSIYKRFEASCDPFKEAMQAIENLSLSVKKRKAAKEYKVPSPFKDRGSFYTPCADPKMEVMKSLQEIKLKRLQKSASKSTKKVTFDLNVIECTPKDTCDVELKPFKKSDNRLTLINEKSEENSPQNEEVEIPISKENMETISNSGDNISDINFPCPQEVKTAVALDKIKKDTCETFCERPAVCTPINKVTPTAISIEVNSQTLSTPQSEELVFHSFKETDPVNVTPDLNFCREKKLDETLTKDTKYTDCQTLRQKKLNNETIKTNQAKLYTPRPFSFYSQYKLVNSSSPEFLEKGAAETLLNLAPICTPLVLRSVAKTAELSPNIDLNPVRLKLNFSEKESPRTKIHKKSTHDVLGKVLTSKNKLDELADAEISSWLLNECVPVVCGRYLTDPVALILNEGDEMHFLPIQP